MYVYGFAGDETIKRDFGGRWDCRRRRWKLDDSFRQRIIDYLTSSLLDEEEDADAKEDTTVVVPQKTTKGKRKRKLYRSESFDSLVNSSDEDADEEKIQAVSGSPSRTSENDGDDK